MISYHPYMEGMDTSDRKVASHIDRLRCGNTYPKCQGEDCETGVKKTVTTELTPMNLMLVVVREHCPSL